MTAEHDETDPADLRVSDAEREHVLGLLQVAMERGMLDPEEYGARSEQAARARTRRELNEVMIDLAVSSAPEAGRATASNDVVRLGGTFSSVKRKGVWRVPRKLVLRRRMGSVELDFTEAQIEHPVVEIELDIGGGSVEMRLPGGASVSIDELHARFASVQDHRKHMSATGNPHFVISGDVRWGSVELRGPRRGVFGRR
ncbi:MAG: DUF1707 SHOCT-like domain-containing protein [Sciscionella sp.]